jgi:hypothetical protein
MSFMIPLTFAAKLALIVDYKLHHGDDGCVLSKLDAAALAAQLSGPNIDCSADYIGAGAVGPGVPAQVDAVLGGVPLQLESFCILYADGQGLPGVGSGATSINGIMTTGVLRGLRTTH